MDLDSLDVALTRPAWQLFALAGLVGATFVVFMSRGQSAAAIILLSVTIFAAAAVGIAALRTLTPFVGERRRRAARWAASLGGRTRAALEREKTLTLRSIKELEFDRAMGKVSDVDFAEMAAACGRKAAGLIRRLDAGASYREQIDRELARRGGRRGAAPRAASRDVCARMRHRQRRRRAVLRAVRPGPGPRVKPLLLLAAILTAAPAAGPVADA